MWQITHAAAHRMRHTCAVTSRVHDRDMPARRPPGRLIAAAVAVLAAASWGAAPVDAQEPVQAACPGVVVDATVIAGTIPGGSWTALDTCVPPEAVYEAEVLGYRLVGGMGIGRYTDGHLGRVAFVTAEVAENRSLTLVGVEDQATGVVTWAYSDGGFARAGSLRTTGGEAQASTIPEDADPGPVEPARVELSVEGTGTDLATAEGPVADQIRVFLDQAVAALST